MKPETRNCQNCKQIFLIDQEDFNFYEKMQVPAPTFCPACRMIRRFNYRNEAMLFRRKDAHSGKEIFSGFSPEADVLTYDNNFWYSAEWDPLENGLEYDFSKNFFEQYKKLLSTSPLPARSVKNLINSDYCNEMSESKNSYLCFNCDYIENSAYLRKITYTKDSFDSYDGVENELCYEDVLVDKSYRTFFSLDCESCVDVWFSKGLRGCTDCFGCVNLVHKKYHFFNEAYSKEEYFEKIGNFTSKSFSSINAMKEKTQDFWLKFPVKYGHNLRILNSTGERIFDSKNVKDSYSVRKGENLRYCQDIQPQASNSYDYFVWGPGENVYECVTCGIGCYNIKFCLNCWEDIENLEYCTYCSVSKNCFGCVGLYKKQYCIFNRQYTREEYEKLRENIIKQMSELPYQDKNGRVYKYGEFFPFEISPIAYNESSAQDFFPIDAQVAQKNGYLWRDINIREYETTVSGIDLPDNIDEVGDSIVEEIIKCKSCERAYRIISKELQFYKRIGLPLPHLCHNCRFLERFKFINPPQLWHRKCMNEGCNNEFETSYAPERPEIVYCETCYQKEVY